jgi:hypothetical protein
LQVKSVSEEADRDDGQDVLVEDEEGESERSKEKDGGE